MYKLGFRDSIFKKLKKMQGKNKQALLRIEKKIEQIQSNPYRFKPLHAPYQNRRRVHIDKSFVLVYSIDEMKKEIMIEDYNHHDNIYENVV